MNDAAATAYRIDCSWHGGIGSAKDLEPWMTKHGKWPYCSGWDWSVSDWIYTVKADFFAVLRHANRRIQKNVIILQSEHREYSTLSSTTSNQVWYRYCDGAASHSLAEANTDLWERAHFDLAWLKIVWNIVRADNWLNGTEGDVYSRRSSIVFPNASNLHSIYSAPVVRNILLPLDGFDASAPDIGALGCNISIYRVIESSPCGLGLVLSTFPQFQESQSKGPPS